MHEKRVMKSYYRELVGALLLYGLLLVLAIRFARPLPESTLRTAWLLSPMIGFGAAIWAMARHINRVDEYVRKFLLETVALGAAVTAGLTFTYGFLETAGFPRLSMFTVWCVLCGATVLVGLVRKLLDR
ncbi:hypothetical protein [Massilia sp. GCM10023247]|uniref:hypothetical protein n=1 Tax=Massilia sp. GCM10023247 TaxID=3252643 RepID=UPI0036062FAD